VVRNHRKYCTALYYEKFIDKFNSKPSLFRTRRPKLVDPSTYLNPSLQNMFTLNYVSTKEMIPAGWNTIEEDKQYPTLASRNPQLQQHSDHSSSGYAPNGHNGSESSGEDSGYQENTSTTRMAEESDEDEPSPRQVRYFLPISPQR
jgi:ubiquitin carboxyl-terminal hydrolase 4/11